MSHLRRSLTLIGAVSVLVCSAQLPSRAQEKPPSIEVMLREATERAREESSQIQSRVKAQVAIFKFRGVGTAIAHASARKKLAAMGFGAVGPLVEMIKGLKQEPVLEQIGLSLLEMKDKETATVEDIATPLRDMIDAKSPMHAATAISVLAAIGDKSSLDSIRLQGDREDTLVKAAVLVARARLADLDCFPALERAAKSSIAEIRRAAAKSYGIIGRNPQDRTVMVDLVSDADDRVAIDAIHALKRISTNSKAMAALHETLRHDNPKFISVAIDVIEEIGKREYSGRHLLKVVKRTSLTAELRMKAAQVLYRLGDEDGMMELAKSYKSQIKSQPRSVRARQALAEYFVEFAAWDKAARTYKEALQLSRRGTQQNDLSLKIAQCYAYDGSFKRAATFLMKTGRDKSWQDLVDDPAFRQMQKDKRWGKYFFE